MKCFPGYRKYQTAPRGFESLTLHNEPLKKWFFVFTNVKQTGQLGMPYWPFTYNLILLAL